MSCVVFPECTDYQKGPLCYACGVELCKKRRCHRKKRCPRGYSVEHIPPKAFFEQNKNIETIISNPVISEITVPSCSLCNHQASKSDEYFVRYIVILAAAYSPIADEILHKIGDKWRKNKKISREFSQAQHGFCDIQTPSGIIIGRQHTVTIPKKHLRHIYACLDKIAKALYYKHTGKYISNHMNLSWSNVLLHMRVTRLEITPLNPSMLSLIKTAFASMDTERSENGMTAIIRHRSLQNNLFRYAFLNLTFQNGDDWPIVFLSFYDSAQFIYLLDEKEENS